MDTSLYRIGLFFLAVASSGLGGCTAGVSSSAIPTVGGVTAPLAQFEVVSVVASDKTVGDHIISFTSGKDCSSVRAQLGQYYCKEDEPKDPPKPYCYRTLGNVTCYSASDPYNGQQQPLGRDEEINAQLAKPGRPAYQPPR